MRLLAKIGAIVLLSLLLVLAVGATVLATFNWNHARPWVGRHLTELVHHPVEIHGDLSVHWRRPDRESGWRSWVPWPEITAHDIVVGNPEWIGSSENMAKAQRLSVVVNPLALLDKTVQLSHLQLAGAEIVLQRKPDGTSNWSLNEHPAENKKPSRWTFDVQDVALQDVSAQYVDTANKLNVNTALNTLKEHSEQGYGIGWKATGRYNGADISGEGRSGGVLSFREGSEPFPLQGGIKVGETRIEIEGSVTRPTHLAALDVRLKLAGDTMADLQPLINVVLPNTPPYATEGRLIGDLNTEQTTWTYEEFTGTMGDSDLEGTLHYQMREPRALLKGKVESKLLRLKDLGPLIGLPTSGKEQKKDEDKAGGKTRKQPADKVLPVAHLSTRVWGAMDADVEFKGRKIMQSKNLPLDDVEAHIKLQDRVLSFTPLNFGVAGGSLKSNIELDGHDEDIKAKMDVSARHLKLNKLLPGIESMDASLGQLHGDAALTGHGPSIAQMLGTSNGELKALVTRGTISHFLLETAGLNIANMVIVKLFGDEQIIMNCLAADFGIKDGSMHARTFVLDTKDAVVTITGDINLATERLDMDINPENKSVRVFTLRTPLYLKGSFKNPEVGVHKAPLAARAGAAVVLGIVATPLAALIPLLNIGTDDSSNCGPLEAKAAQKPQAPPPDTGKEHK